jgi:hypothetical protein
MSAVNVDSVPPRLANTLSPAVVVSLSAKTACTPMGPGGNATKWRFLARTRPVAGLFTLMIVYGFSAGSITSIE